MNVAFYAWLEEGAHIRWDYFWFGELDMQYCTIPRLYYLVTGVVAPS